MNTGMNFSESLSKYRKATGISQEKLAEMLGVSRRYQNGRRARLSRKWQIFWQSAKYSR